ncbi:hypothetical protein NPIL_94631 [Nephila pilipes]|uniref:Uncharacterized protein n=2 Tax=Nephila pilipes TaxID=299642 RepID=A0A8X6Q0M1_NEPPI|nr:hypothetical protein NPIL_94631 [Nephila pilipes]
MDGIDDENTFLLDDELHSDTDTDISSNYLDYSSDDSCNEYDVDQLRVEPQRIVLKPDLPVSLRPSRTFPSKEKEIEI